MAAPTIEEFLQMLQDAEAEQKKEQERINASNENIPLEVPEMNEKIEEKIEQKVEEKNEEKVEEKVEESIEEKPVKKSRKKYTDEQRKTIKQQENKRYYAKIKSRMEADSEYREKILSYRREKSIKRAKRQKEQRRQRRLQREKEAAENTLTEQHVLEMLNGMM